MEIDIFMKERLKSGVLVEKWKFRGGMVENRGFGGKMEISRGLWSKIGVLVENGGFFEK